MAQPQYPVPTAHNVGTTDTISSHGQVVPAHGNQQPMYNTPTTGEGMPLHSQQQGYAANQQQQPAYTPGVGTTVTNNAGVQDWNNSFWDCCSPMDLCCVAYWCPCYVFGKTHERLRDPSLQSFSGVNGYCLGWVGLNYCGLQWVLQMMNRTEIRDKFNLDGSTAGDCARSFCCPFCGIMQEEKELRLRTNGLGGPTAQPQGYQAPQPGGMTYPPQKT